MSKITSFALGQLLTGKQFRAHGFIVKYANYEGDGVARLEFALTDKEGRQLVRFASESLCPGSSITICELDEAFNLTVKPA